MKSTATKIIELRPEVLRASEQLEIHPKKRLSAPYGGSHPTAHRGSGMQFKEFRHYEPGDDIRHVSWAVTARTGRTTLKVFEEDREINTVLLIDTSGSSLAGERKRKIDMYTEIMATVGLASLKSGNPFGSVFFSDQLNGYYRPQKSRAQLMHALGDLNRQELEGEKSELGSTLTRLAQVLHHPSLLLILSDFRMADFSSELRFLSRRHEIVLLHGYDDRERNLPADGVLEVSDPEGEGFWLLDSGSPGFRETLQKEFLDFTRSLEDLAAQTRGAYLGLSLHDDYLQRLVHFFRARG